MWDMWVYRDVLVDDPGEVVFPLRRVSVRLHLFVSGHRGDRRRCRCHVCCLLGVVCLRLKHTNESRGLVVGVVFRISSSSCRGSI